MKKIFTLIAAATFLGALNTNAQCTGDRYKMQVFGAATVTSDILYGNNINLGGISEDLFLDVYEPTGDTETSRPLVIIAHGGNFISGQGSKTGADVVPLAEHFAKMGYVVASIDYRVDFNNFPIPGPDSVDATETVVRAVHDFRAAIRYFKKDYSVSGNTFDIDTNKIIIGGVSAGAITAVQVAYLDDITELPSYIDTTQAGLGGGIEGNSGNPGYSSQGSIGIINIAGAIRDTSWMTSTSMPILSLHGDLDGTVPYETDIITLLGLVDIMKVHGSFTMEKRATNIGLDNCLYTHFGAGHVPHVGNDLYTDTTETLMRNFLATLLCNDVMVCDYNGTTHTDVSVSESKNEITKIYPNPAIDVINITSSNLIEEIKITNLLGEIVYSKENISSTNLEIQRNNLTVGVYLLTIKTVNGVTTKKVSFE